VEGYDRIPQQILKDGSEHLVTPYFTLMSIPKEVNTGSMGNKKNSLSSQKEDKNLIVN
jgi:hypothetical protein